MPLRDHFRPPASRQCSWEGLHAGWPMVIVQRLFTILPEGYVAEPRARLGAYFEIDIGGFDTDAPSGPEASQASGVVATLPWSPPQPTRLVDVDIGEQDEFEVLVYDEARGRRLVAAVELVSPGNKDRPEHRQALVAKCATLLRQGVCVVIVDLVTIRQFNIHVDLMTMLGQPDPAWGEAPPATYATACRPRRMGRRPVLETWAYAMEVGRPLPTLPLWLDEELAVPLELEPSYEETCRVLRVV